jgi:hypothetical protein
MMVILRAQGEHNSGRNSATEIKFSLELGRHEDIISTPSATHNRNGNWLLLCVELIGKLDFTSTRSSVRGNNYEDTHSPKFSMPLSAPSS